MRRIHNTLAALGLTAAVGLVTLAGGLSATAAGPRSSKPVINDQTFTLLSKLGSYHIDSSWASTTGKQKSQSVHFSEDVHGKDYHLVVMSSDNGNKKAEFIYAGGHFYVSENGNFQDLGDLGKQLAQPMLMLTTGYWNAFFLDSTNVHYVGRVTTSGRSAQRYTVVFGYAGLAGISGSNAGIASVHFTNTVDIDMATHAPLRIVGSYYGKDTKGVVSTLKNSFFVSKIGKVGAIHVP